MTHEGNANEGNIQGGKHSNVAQLKNKLKLSDPKFTVISILDCLQCVLLLRQTLHTIRSVCMCVDFSIYFSY